MENKKEWNHFPFDYERLIYDKYYTPQNIIKYIDSIEKPAHYNDYPVEVIEIIKRTLTKEQFIGYCLGNEIKYRMRCGLKTSDTQEDIKKAMKYREFRKGVE